MEKICKGHIESIPEEQATKMIALTSTELTMSTEVLPDWQGAASQLLSALGIRYAELVMKELLIKFQPGGSPHYFVVYTLGLLATSNGMFLSIEVFLCVLLMVLQWLRLCLCWELFSVA